MLRAQGVESEAPLPFAALHRLLRPVLGILDRVPAPQARALRAAFGEADDVAVEPFLAALATLSVLTEAAEDATVLCVLDDAQWLDQATTDAVLVAARRLGADRVAVVFAARDGEGHAFAPDGVPAVALTPLTSGAARALLAEAAGGAVPDDVADRLMTQAAGNPLALVELPSTLSAEQLAGAEPLPTQLHLTAGIERVFLDRCRRLPPDVQTLLLVAAADDSGHVATVRAAATQLGAGPDSLDAAERSGLLVVDGDIVRVRHPLVRSAVYQAATSRERHEAHRALADALGPQADPDRYAWHRAAAVDSPDPDVVTGLTAAGQRAERRGGYAAASAAYQRAAELTADEQDRAAAPVRRRPHRLVRRADHHGARAVHGGTRARRRPGAARRHRPAPRPHRGQRRVRDRRAPHVRRRRPSRPRRRPHPRARARRRRRPAEHLRRRQRHRPRHRHPRHAALATDAITSHTTSGATPRTRCLGHLLLALTRAAAHDWAPALTSLRDALKVGADIGDLDLLSHLGNTALHLGDDEAHHRCFTAMAAGARDAGAGMLVLYALPRLGFTQVVTGRWAALRGSAEEALSLSASTGQPALAAAPLGWVTVLAALQGAPAADYDQLLTDLDAAARQPLGVLADPVHDLTRWAQGTRAAHDGDTRAALHHLASIRISAINRLTAVDRIDAAVRAGDHEQAAAWVKELTPFAEGTGWPWALAAVNHGRALLAEPARRTSPVRDRPDPSRRRRCPGGRQAVRPGPHPPRLRRAAAPHPAPRRRPHPPARRPRDVRGPARRAARRPRQPGAPGVRGDRPQTRPVHPAHPDTDGTPGQVNYIASCKREHSRKPGELYPIIEACSPGPYLELFARGAVRKGWVTWGDQADDDYRPTEGGVSR